MVKTFAKTIYRMFLSNKGRFIANVLIVLISIAISAGLANLPSMYQESFSRNYSSGKAADIILKNKTEEGFAEDDLDKVKSSDGVVDAYSFTCIDVASENGIYRIYVMDLHQENNRLTLLEGKYPSKEYSVQDDIAVLAEVGNQNRNGYELSSRVKINTPSLSSMGVSSLTFQVCGTVKNPLYNSVQRENANLQGVTEENLMKTYIDAIFYVDASLVPEMVKYGMFEIPTSSILVKTDLYVFYSSSNVYFSKKYQNEMNQHKEGLEELLGKERTVGLTLEENVSYALFENYNRKVEIIAFLFPFFFILVCALVNSITISRLIEDERKIIATYVSLGVRKGKIVFKYLLFTFCSTFLGGLIGILLGMWIIPVVVLPAYDAVFVMNSLSFSLISPYGIFSAIAVVLVAMAVTLFSSLSSLKETPSSLMKNKSPKPGKKIWLQSIPFLWKPLSFKYKSSLRNIFRQKKNLILTSLSIIGATLLVFIGFALLDVSNSLVNDPLFGSVASSMGLISLVIILFALSMGIVVIYSLANMNVLERQRELATLKVLGYHDSECLFYCFREIIMVCTFACILGLPISALIVAFVFDYLEFGSIWDVRWTSYLYSFLVIVMMSVVINLLLYPKIKKIDMNDSLKTLE